MIVLDKPFVSNFLEDTLIEMQVPVLKNAAIQDMKLNSKINFLEESRFIEMLKKNPTQPLFSNSENSINWINKNLDFMNLSEKILVFKDKFLFRKTMQPYFPKFYFQQIKLDELESLNLEEVPFPFIIKPSIGFFSLGVYVVQNREEWPKIISAIRAEMASNKDVFPIEVVNSTNFIIEEMIDGDEYAVDVYFNENGKPSILNILKHYFASPEDTSDRLYITSKEIITQNRETFLKTLENINEATSIRNFPMHIEFRVDEKGNVGIIEANPMRFAGLCVTDLAYFAWGTNNYRMFFEGSTPDWDKVMRGKENKTYAMVVGDIPKEINREDIASIDYEKFASKFTRPLEIRQMDYRKFPLFAIAFVEFDESTKDEMLRILNDDLIDCIILK
ncbi:ATP-grasp domain-containing protein [Candidatus Lokiarchaeum ossiferum]|uniref:ATP-grasp domain-containing protein n=1 Tax=Candidatus Lokiarchaeum ossiferum TaxID=2951803 RepID=UPI00352CE42C